LTFLYFSSKLFLSFCEKLYEFLETFFGAHGL
jgi:hypothetical protein